MNKAGKAGVTIGAIVFLGWMAYSICNDRYQNKQIKTINSALDLKTKKVTDRLDTLNATEKETQTIITTKYDSLFGVTKDISSQLKVVKAKQDSILDGLYEIGMGMEYNAQVAQQSYFDIQTEYNSINTKVEEVKAKLPPPKKRGFLGFIGDWFSSGN